MRNIVCGLIAAGTIFAWQARADLAEPTKVNDGDKPIDVEIAHSVPYVVDWNGDGKKDLLVGQFGGGKLRVYLNSGTDKEPVFKGFEFVKDKEGKDLSVPCG